MENPADKILDANETKPTIVQIVPDPNKPIRRNSVKNPVPFEIPNPTSSSIIRIVPNNPNKLNKQPLPQKCLVKTFIVSRQNNQPPKSSPSTSTSLATDHEYICKEEVIEEPLDIIYLNASQEVSEDVINEMLEKESGSGKLNSSNSKRHLEDDILEIPEKISKVHSENCCHVCRDTLETILRRQEEIIGYLKNGPTNLCKDLRFDLLPPMPFNDLNDFLDFDESLSNENVLEQLITKLQRLLVTIEKKSVSNIMSSILTNDLSKRISWIGIKDSIAFQNTNMVNHIIDIVLDHHGTDVDTIKGYIAEWLRRCSDRIASEVRKNNKKRTHQYKCDDT